MRTLNRTRRLFHLAGFFRHTEQATKRVPLLRKSSVGRRSLAGTACKRAVARGHKDCSFVSRLALILLLAWTCPSLADDDMSLIADQPNQPAEAARPAAPSPIKEIEKQLVPNASPQPASKEPAVTMPTEAASDLPKTLDQALAQAMERNPGIATAKAKVHLAEAELDATRMEVSRRIVDLWTERQSEQTRMAMAQRAQANAVPQDLISIGARLARIKTELHYLIGQTRQESNRIAIFPNGDSTNNTSTQQGTARAPAQLQLPKGPDVEKVRAKLLDSIQWDFADMALSDVVAYLKDATSLEFQVDKQALEDAGLGADTLINISIKAATFAAALQAFDDQFPLFKIVVRDYGLLLTTPERAKEQGYFPVVDFARLSSGNISPPKDESDPFAQ